MAGVTKEEVVGVLRLANLALADWPHTRLKVSATIRKVESDGLDPGPHPSLKAIEERLTAAVKKLDCGVCVSAADYEAYDAVKSILDDLRSGSIPPAPTEAEVAKLRAELAEVSGGLAAAKALIGRQSAKIDGLRSAPEAATRIDSERCLEIARLKADLQRVLENNAEQAKALDVARREVAALQDRNGRQYETIKGQDAEIGVLRAEVERLRRTVETGIIRRPTWKIDLSETTGAVAALADGVTRLVGRLERFESEVARLNEINDRADRIPAGA